MPRLKLRRFKVTPPSDDIYARYALTYDGRTLHHAPATLPPLSPQTVFGNADPFVLDIGCGRGEFLLTLAQAGQMSNIVGLEWHRKSVYDAVNKLHAADIHGVKVVRGDVRDLVTLMPDACCTLAFLLFPPPRTDPRREKDDLLSDKQMRAYHRVLRPGALFHFVTDDDAYFAQKTAQMQSSGLFRLLEQREGFEGGMTDFQQRWEAWGITSKRAVFARAAST